MASMLVQHAVCEAPISVICTHARETAALEREVLISSFVSFPSLPPPIFPPEYPPLSFCRKISINNPSIRFTSLKSSYLPHPETCSKAVSHQGRHLSTNSTLH